MLVYLHRHSPNSCDCEKLERVDTLMTLSHITSCKTQFLELLHSIGASTDTFELVNFHMMFLGVATLLSYEREWDLLDFVVSGTFYCLLRSKGFSFFCMWWSYFPFKMSRIVLDVLNNVWTCLRRRTAKLHKIIFELSSKAPLFLVQGFFLSCINVKIHNVLNILKSYL